MRAVLMWMKLSLIAACVMAVPAQAQAQTCKKKKKSVKKVVKKGAKKTKKTVKKADKKSIAKSSAASIKAARKELNKSGKRVNQATGAIDGLVDKAYDLTDDEMRAAYRHTKQGLKTAAKQTKKLADAAVKKLFKNAFTKNVKRYSTLIYELAKAGVALQDELAVIGKHAMKGNLKKVEELANALAKHPKLQKAIQIAHRDWGTSLVIGFAASAGVGGKLGPVALDGSGGVAIGHVVHLDPDKDASVESMAFFSAGGAVGAGVSAGPSPISFGGSFSGLIGVVRKGPRNYKGTCVDVSANVQVNKVVASTGLCFPTDFKSQIGLPSALTVAVGAALPLPTDHQAGFSIGVGASHTKALAVIKRKKKN